MKTKVVIKPIIKKIVPFNRLSKTNQRIALAEDVIKQIKVKKYYASRGTYFQQNAIQKMALYNGLKLKDELNKILPELECECCAKGSLFLSHITKTNNCSVRNIISNVDFNLRISKRLNNLFTQLQLDLIETAFEMKVIKDYSGKLYQNEGLIEKAINFGEKYANSNNRLIGIMKNVIKNKGIFKP